jgi:Arylsulfotransferase (ASST)
LLCGLLLFAAIGGASAHVQADGLHTLHGIKPPVLQVTHPAAAGVAPGFVFVGQKGGGKSKPGGPVIADNKGRVLWFDQLKWPVEVTDFRTQTYKGKPVLTWWQGTVSKAGVGSGVYEVYDTSYKKIAEVHAQHGFDGDLHEFQLTPRGTAFITIYDEVPRDLTGVGGPKDGWVLDSIVQEIDVATGRVVFEWHSLDHVRLAESLQANREPALHATNKRPFDYFHINSIADAPGGNILVSGRNVSALFLLARDGHIVWQFGGKHSRFGPAAAVKLRYQHNARLHPGNVLTVFDNGAIPKAEPYTRPLKIKLDVAHKTATILKAFVHPQKLLSPFEGNMQLLPNGGAFVGWGGIRRVTEFSPAGKVLFELKLPFGDTYRGYRAVWHGSPGGKPLVSVDGQTVFASWNGRTDIDHWDVVSGGTTIGSHAFTGLETAISVSGDASNAEVRAVDASGHVLGATLAG